MSDSIHPKLSLDAVRQHGTEAVAEMELSFRAYQEIRNCLSDAGWDHAFEGDLIDMRGIALVPGDGVRDGQDRQRVALVVPSRAAGDTLSRLLPGCLVLSYLAPIGGPAAFDLVVVFGGRPGPETGGGSDRLARAHATWFEGSVKIRIRPGGLVIFAA